MGLGGIDILAKERKSKRNIRNETRQQFLQQNWKRWKSRYNQSGTLSEKE